MSTCANERYPEVPMKKSLRKRKFGHISAFGR